MNGLEVRRKNEFHEDASRPRQIILWDIQALSKLFDL